MFQLPAVWAQQYLLSLASALRALSESHRATVSSLVRLLSVAIVGGGGHPADYQDLQSLFELRGKNYQPCDDLVLHRIAASPPLMTRQVPLYHANPATYTAAVSTDTLAAKRLASVTVLASPAPLGNGLGPNRTQSHP